MLSKNELKKEFLGLFKHTERLSVSLELVHAADLEEPSFTKKIR